MQPANKLFIVSCLLLLEATVAGQDTIAKYPFGFDGFKSQSNEISMSKSQFFDCLKYYFDIVEDFSGDRYKPSLFYLDSLLFIDVFENKKQVLKNSHPSESASNFFKEGYDNLSSYACRLDNWDSKQIFYNTGYLSHGAGQVDCYYAVKDIKLESALKFCLMEGLMLFHNPIKNENTLVKVMGVSDERLPYFFYMDGESIHLYQPDSHPLYDPEVSNFLFRRKYVISSSEDGIDIQSLTTP